MGELIAATDNEVIELVLGIELSGSVEVEARLRSLLTVRRLRRFRLLGIRSEEDHVLKTHPQTVESLLDQVAVAITDLLELRCWHPDIKIASIAVAEARRLEPRVIRMPIDLLFQRVQHARPEVYRSRTRCCR